MTKIRFDEIAEHSELEFFIFFRGFATVGCLFAFLKRRVLILVSNLD